VTEHIGQPVPDGQTVTMDVITLRYCTPCTGYMSAAFCFLSRFSPDIVSNIRFLPNAFLILTGTDHLILGGSLPGTVCQSLTHAFDYYYYYYFFFLSSLLCRVFTIIHRKQTMFLAYTVLQLFCSYNLCYV